MGSLNEWYAGRSIFVTGGSGFMGKVLLEKLIRCLPDLNKVYVLIRSKRGMSPSARLQHFFTLPVFQKLSSENPERLKKLVAVEGDIHSGNLGLSPASLEMLVRDVSVVVHAAATLKLEANLRDALNTNTISTVRVLDICEKFPKLESMLYVSTAFCHCDVDVLEEKVYPVSYKYQDILKIVDMFDNDTLEKITPRIIAPHVNCYTYSKRLAESVVYEYRSKLPVAIVRPSMVIPAMREPCAGWVDSLNGPVGILAAGGKGVLRSMLGNPDYPAELIPVDIAIDGIIAIAKFRATESFNDVPVYNVTQGEVEPITWGEVMNKGLKAIVDYPFDWPIWYPRGRLRTNEFIHYLIIFLFHKIPAYFIDFIMLLLMQKRFMVRIQNRISMGLESLKYFTTRKWNFVNKEFLSLTDKLNDEDKEIFYMTNIKYDIDTYIISIILGTRKYCLKEDLSTIPRARKFVTFLYFLNLAAKVTFLYYFIYITLSCFGIGHMASWNYWKNNIFEL